MGFITGASRGFGREWTEAALGRGDRVAAAARHTDSLRQLKETFGEQVLPLELDVTDRKACFDAMAKTASHFGGVDIVVNNAGYGLFGMVEEIDEEQARGNGRWKLSQNH